ncbi:MAG: DUF2817 domain-containing protein [Caulobacteraceae bacterium]
MIHAINPYGFAWLRRVTEENIDLNRNWIDFSQPPPANPGYDELADAARAPRMDPREPEGLQPGAADLRRRAWPDGGCSRR